MIKAIIFDFDGVLVESVDIKADAFAYIFRQYPAHKDEIVKLHLANGGVNRFDKIRWIYRDILKKPLAEEKLKELGEEFSNYVYKKVISSSFVPGAKEFLEKYLNKMMLFIISGTPQEEIMSIVREKGLSKYFLEVLGAPEDKGSHATKILEKYRLAPDEVVFLGDAYSDYEGANKSGIRFVARVVAGKYDPFAELEIEKKVTNLFEFENYLLETKLI